MNEINGYVKIHRKLLQWGWYQDHAVKEVWLHLLLTAAFRKSSYRGIDILPGQCIVSTEQMAKDLGFTRQQVRTAINKLKSTNEITSKSTNKFSVVTLVNWEEYQLKEKTITNKSTNTLTNEQPTNNQQITNKQPHLKNVKNVKNIKNNNSAPTRACACTREGTATEERHIRKEWEVDPALIEGKPWSGTSGRTF